MEEYKIENNIVATLCLLAGESADRIKSRKEQKSLAIHRHSIAFVLRDIWHWEFEKIGRHMNRHHATIINGIENLNNITTHDKELRENISNWIDTTRELKEILDKSPIPFQALDI